MEITHQLSHSAMMLLAGIWPGAIALGLIGMTKILLFRRQAARAHNWPIVEGVINTARIQKVKSGSNLGHGNSRKTAYRSMIVYSYSVAGVRREGTRIQFGSPRRAFPKSKMQQRVDFYPEGKTVRVHYDPDRPGESVLETGVDPILKTGLLFSVTMLLLGVVGVGIAYF